MSFSAQERSFFRQKRPAKFDRATRLKTCDVRFHNGPILSGLFLQNKNLFVQQKGLFVQKKKGLVVQKNIIVQQKGLFAKETCYIWSRNTSTTCDVFTIDLFFQVSFAKETCYIWKKNIPGGLFQQLRVIRKKILRTRNRTLFLWASFAKKSWYVREPTNWCHPVTRETLLTCSHLFLRGGAWPKTSPWHSVQYLCTHSAKNIESFAGISVQ